MKRVILLLSFVFLTVNMLGQTLIIDRIVYNFDSQTKTAEVTSNGFGYYSGDIDIPESVFYSGETYTVTSIGDRVFRYCNGLTGITIPGSVTNIGEQAFIGCSSLREFLGNCAFISSDHRSLIDNGAIIAFAPNGLSAYTIPEDVTSIGEDAFYGCM